MGGSSGGDGSGGRGPPAMGETEVAELSFGHGPNGTIIGGERYLRNRVGDDKDEEVPEMPPIPAGLVPVGSLERK